MIVDIAVRDRLVGVVRWRRNRLLWVAGIWAGLSAVATTLLAVAVNAASNVDSHWPYGLESLREHPFRWAAVFTVVTALAGLLFTSWQRNLELNDDQNSYRSLPQQQRTSAGEDRRLLHQALLAAYPTRSALAQMLDFDLEVRLANIVGDVVGMDEAVFVLVTIADSGGWIPDLIAAAARRRPDHVLLQQLYANLQPPGGADIAHDVDTAPIAGPTSERRDLSPTNMPSLKPEPSYWLDRAAAAVSGVPAPAPLAGSGRIILPFYILVDVSASMSGDIEALNAGLHSLIREADVEPANDLIMISVITFASSAETVVKLAPPNMITLPALEAGGGSNYGAGFRELRRSMDEDHRLITKGDARIYRPVVLLLTGTMPDDTDYLETFKTLFAYNPQTKQGNENYPLVGVSAFRDASFELAQNLAYPDFGTERGAFLHDSSGGRVSDLIGWMTSVGAKDILRPFGYEQRQTSRQQSHPQVVPADELFY